MSDWCLWGALLIMWVLQDCLLGSVKNSTKSATKQWPTRNESDHDKGRHRSAGWSKGVKTLFGVCPNFSLLLIAWSSNSLASREVIGPHDFAPRSPSKTPATVQTG